MSHFYAGLRWPRWREDVAGLGFDQGSAVLPPQWSGAAPATRSVVPMADILNRQFDTARRRGRRLADVFSRCPVG